MERTKLRGKKEKVKPQGMKGKVKPRGIKERAKTQGFKERPRTQGFKERPRTQGFKERAQTQGIKEKADNQDTKEKVSNQDVKEKAKTQDRKEKREKKKFDFERNSRTIFVGNLPNTLDHKGVAKLFKSCGTVEAARIRSVVPEKEKLPPKVALITNRMHPKVDSFNAYVVFKTNEDDECVKKALAMNGNVIDGHHIRVDRAQRPKAKKETLTSRKKSIFVGNLRFDIRDDELINHFNKVGNVDYVRIVRDRSSGLGKGFGFVVFKERADVKKALELNETQFKGRTLRIKKIDTKPE